LNLTVMDLDALMAGKAGVSCRWLATHGSCHESSWCTICCWVFHFANAVYFESLMRYRKWCPWILISSLVIYKPALAPGRASKKKPGKAESRVS
jgi:hypothetical protein